MLKKSYKLQATSLKFPIVGSIVLHSLLNRNILKVNSAKWTTDQAKFFTKSICFLYSIILLSSSIPLSFSATGDIVEPQTGSGAVITEKRKEEEQMVLTISTPFTTDREENKVKEQIINTVFRLKYNKEQFEFRFLPDTFTLQKQTYLLFYNKEIRLTNEHNVQDFPTITKYTLQLPRKVLLEYIEKNVIPHINREKKDVKIKKQDDKIIFEGTAENGELVDMNGLIKSMIFSLQYSAYTLQIPVTEEKAQVYKEGLEDVNIQELIGTGLSDMGGSPKNRIHNIHTGLSKFNGIVIKQGEEFSFNKQLGAVDGAHGFLPELVIKGNKTIPEMGGGLCQVSSTMFRAALFSGLPILARTNHSYAVSYYEPPYGWGFDATVYIGGPDLKFKNDTPGDILVQTYTEGTKVYYKFYGISDKRKVNINGPFIWARKGIPGAVTVSTPDLPAGVKKLKEYGHPGFSASFDRAVVYFNGEEMNNTFKSIYQARPALYLVGATPEASATTEGSSVEGQIGNVE